jgi:POT family proton-dependent oligopeptide transporter
MIVRKTYIKMNQPHGLYTLCFAELVERLSYCGIQSLLVLYLLKALAIPEMQSYSVYGAFVGLTFITSIGAGIIADRVLGLRRAVSLGGVSILLGNMALALPLKHLVYPGLSLIVIGTGFFKPNCAGLVGSLYDNHDRRRDTGYTVYYMWTNIGGLLGPIIYGIIAEQYSWQYSFIISAIGMLVGIIIYQLNKQQFDTHAELARLNRLSVWLVYLFLPLYALLLWFLLLHPKLVGYLLNTVAVITALAFLAYCIFSQSQERLKVILIVGLILICLGYFALVFQTSTSLTLFIEHYVDRTVLDWKIPAETFVSLEPLFVALGAPIATYFWLRYDKLQYSYLTLVKVSSGLLLGGLGFLTFAATAKYVGLISGEQHAIPLLMIGNLLIGFGELCIAPAILSFIAHLAPIKFRGTIMGTYYLALAFSGYVAGLIAKTTSAHLTTESLIQATQAYTNTYLTLASYALSLSLIVFFVARFTKKYKI